MTHSKIRERLLAIAHSNLKYLRKSEKDNQKKSYSPFETKCIIFVDVEVFILINGQKLKIKVDGQPFLTSMSSRKVNSIIFLI